VSALEEYRKALAQATSESDDHVLVHLADAAIAELEADLRATQNVLQFNIEKRQQAEVEVAVRDRMLKTEYDSPTPKAAGYMRWWANLLTRAEADPE